jgi:hypothetical protein
VRNVDLVCSEMHQKAHEFALPSHGISFDNFKRAGITMMFSTVDIEKQSQFLPSCKYKINLINI